MESAVAQSLRAGEPVTVDTSAPTMMAGLNCGTPSGIGWPTIRDGVSAAVTDRSADWTPPDPDVPPAGDLTPATDIPAPPDAPEGGDPFDGWLWGLEEIDAAGAHEVTTGRREVRVGVIDTGVDSSHPDLAPVLDTGLSRSFVSDLPEIDGSCEVDSCVDPVGVDDGGHGTHVAGTIAAAANDLGVTGVAPGITLVDLRAGQDSGTFFLGPTVNALTYAADQQLDVVNMSYYVDPWLVACPGGAKGDSPEQADFQDVALELMHRAYDLTHEAGVTLVTSAGNDGADMGDPSRDSSSPNYGGDPRNRTIDPKTCERLPLAGEHVISVASVDEGNVRSTFSNWTSTPDDGLVDVAAPGGEETSGRGGILSTPAASCVIRARAAYGGIVLSAAGGGAQAVLATAFDGDVSGFVTAGDRITDVAIDAGYDAPDAFARAFRKRFDIPRALEYLDALRQAAKDLSNLVSETEPT